jgi:hypothetical protein
VWKRIVVRRDAAVHDFPSRHSDYVEQTISYRVPVDKLGELAAFDGSLIPDRGRGELTSRAESEASNYLALNLADEIVSGKKTVPEARRFLSKQSRLSASGKSSTYAEGLLFQQPKSDPADPDRAETGD